MTKSHRIFHCNAIAIPWLRWLQISTHITDTLSPQLYTSSKTECPSQSLTTTIPSQIPATDPLTLYPPKLHN